MLAQINHSNTNMAPQGSAVAVSTVPSELVAVQAILEIQKAAKPQCLQQILASLNYLLTFNAEAQDYHLIVNLVDSAILTGRRTGQLEQLINQITNNTARLASIGNPVCPSAHSHSTTANWPLGTLQHYTPETGKMTIIIMSESLSTFLFRQVTNSVEKNIAGVPGLKLRFKFDKKMPQHICCISYNNKTHC
ncbi:hypothetical protein B0T25DRAFT_529685 [Lasiosphaeria hispida]|uniref:Uncharacterized protein n=1 Tax=Lasiosphaeria hispida TaxID=260671 RepID=A0AAJ0HWM6_9PEZI|nr:hypothetical protein B0T25DRAFT_529685 [Lasiosphaeria hispida]